MIVGGSAGCTPCIGRPYYWLLDPLERTLEALRFEPGSQTWVEIGSYDDASVARIAPFEAIEIQVARFFAPSRV